jgi:endoglucanase
MVTLHMDRFVLHNSLFLILTLSILTYNTSAQSFLYSSNKKIVDSAGNEVLLKGIGLGGWLLMEGYMLQTSGFANAQWQIREKIADLVGESNTELFYEKYRNKFIRKIDIDSIKSWGFNSIRLPFHYDLFSNPPVFIDKGFQIIDSILSWCEADEIYLILDMHAAPGGQSDENISDYNSAYPSLWQSDQNKNLTVEIWRKIAERYKDKEWIGGYDLLNEPKWNLPPNNQPLKDLYIRITDTIRTVDNNHLIFIEGNWFATDFTGLTPAWDENMAYSFHKYWNGNDQSSVQYLVDLRNNTNAPLWLGETGENSNQWFVNCVKLMKDNNIGWAWWTYKKIESISSPLSAYKYVGYQTLLNYWNGQGSKPTETYAMNSLMAETDQLLLENCAYRKDYIDALIRQPLNTTTIPFAENKIPGIVYATDYDMGQLGYAYNDVDYQNTSGNGGSVYNSGWSYRNDGVDIEPCIDFSSNGYNVGWISTGDWLNFTIDVTQAGTYTIKFNIAAQNADGKILLSLDGQYITSAINVPITGGYQTWRYITVENVYFPSGIHTLKAQFFNGGFNFSSMEFNLITTDVKEEINAPISFNLDQNYPNPFNPSTKIQYEIPKESKISIKIYDISGSEITTLYEGQRHPGKYFIEWNAKNFASGIYFCRMISDNFVSVKKLTLIK